MARLFTVRFLSAVRAVAARCKLPFSLHLGLPQDVRRSKEITEEKKEKNDCVEPRKRRRKEHRSVPKPYLRVP